MDRITRTQPSPSSVSAFSIFNPTRLAEAEALFKRAIAIREGTLGPNHHHTAESLYSLGNVYRTQRHLVEAEPLLEQAMAIYMKTLGPNHPSTAFSIRNLATLYRLQGRYSEAEPLLQQALEIQDRSFGPGHPGTAFALNDLGWYYYEQEDFAEAERYFKRMLEVMERTDDHPYLLKGLRDYAALLHRVGRDAEAEALETRAGRVEAERAGSNHESAIPTNRQDTAH